MIRRHYDVVDGLIYARAQWPEICMYSTLAPIMLDRVFEKEFAVCKLRTIDISEDAGLKREQIGASYGCSPRVT
jgi:hypothetical protein